MKTTRIMMFALCCLAGAQAVAEAQEHGAEPRPALQATERDNVVTFQFGNGVREMSFAPERWLVTPGQPLSDIKVEPITNGMRVHVFAGREGSEDVARQWRAYLVEDDHHMLGADIAVRSTTHPEKLNFWITGAWSINGSKVEDGLMVGQGHHYMTNNWWVGNPLAELNNCCRELRVRDSDDHTYCIREDRESGSPQNTFRIDACRPLL